mgnify:CR=1 FL=1
MEIKKIEFKNSIQFWLPILLFVWMAISYFWSIDKPRTLNAIPKEIALFIIPFFCFFIPFFNAKIKAKILKYYSYSILFLAITFLARAFIRYILTHDSRAFFYHGEYGDDYGLVPKLLNAIHVSVYTALAYFYFLTKSKKSKSDIFIILFLFVFIILLASKNIIFVFILLNFLYTFFYSKISYKMRLRNILIIVGILILMFSFNRIKDRFLVEFQSNKDKGLSHNITTLKTDDVHVVSIYEAWNNDQFSHGDYFPGTAFRVYQARMFLEFLSEESIFWKGFGLNASKIKLQEKEKKYNLYPGYGDFNFHNQYIQNFGELGFVGFLILVLILSASFYKSFKEKDFLHIAFIILMISLFLTESFLWRQRGVVFFTAFYCFFNMSCKNKSQSKIN